MTGRTRRTSFIFVVAALTLVDAAAGTQAAEISDKSGLITLAYDQTMWTAGFDGAGEPELDCILEACGGDTASCTVVIVQLHGDGPADRAFLERFRQNLDGKTLQIATSIQGADSRPEIVLPATLRNYGANIGISMSIRITFERDLTRADNFWFLAGSDLAGATCIVADADYDRAQLAFERIYEDLTIHAP